MIDPVIEATAIALAWCERPAGTPETREHELIWWHAQAAVKQRIYRYRARMAIEAYETALAMEMRDAAE